MFLLKSALEVISSLTCFYKSLTRWESALPWLPFVLALRLPGEAGGGPPLSWRLPPLLPLPSLAMAEDKAEAADDKAAKSLLFVHDIALSGRCAVPWWRAHL